jgi:hypothetical protein
MLSKRLAQCNCAIVHIFVSVNSLETVAEGMKETKMQVTQNIRFDISRMKQISFLQGIKLL